LEKLIKLIEFGASNNKFNEINLNKLTKLIHLNLSDNQLSEINGLEKLTELTYLNFTNNKIKTIDLTHNLKINFLFSQKNNSSLKIHLNKKYKGDLPFDFRRDKDALVTYEDPSPELSNPEIKPDQKEKIYLLFLILIPVIFSTLIFFIL
jgi:hypothetical protein